MKRCMVHCSVLLAVVLLASCSTVSVTSDYDRAADFSKLQSYRWPLDSEEIRKGDLLAEHPLVYKRVQSAVDRELRGKGYRKSTSQSADFIVHTHAGIKKLKTYHQRYGIEFPLHNGWYSPWWGPYGGISYVSYYEEGTLVVDIIDASTRELVWRGVATRVVRDYQSPEDMQKDIDEAVAEVLSRFPPGT
ncbi:MAG: DUF4136 domain-containing protein [Prosthecochloris sp.]|nr:DUF4136 domain-containing protein [Prosthecochloris sp.]